MGEKETGALAGDQAAKAAPPRRDEAQRWVQDDTPDGEKGRTVDKSTPELMRGAAASEAGAAGGRSTAMSSIQNLKG
jgi:hypothetical protein